MLNKNKARRITILLTILTLIFITSVAYASISQLISFQGRLTDNDDISYTSPKEFTFSIYDSLTSTTVLWGPETHTLTPDTLGSFDTILGSISKLNLPFNEPYFIEIYVEGEKLEPRYNMTTKPYTYSMNGPSTIAGPLIVKGMIESTFGGGLKLPDGKRINNFLDLNHIWVANGNDIYNSNIGSIGIGTSTPPVIGTKLKIVGDVSNKGNLNIFNSRNDAQFCFNGVCVTDFREILSMK